MMARQLIEKTIRNFLNTVTDNDIYNEFSMQHELGIKLREEFEKYNTVNNCHFVVQFERNRRFFGINDPTPIISKTYIPKSEIDIVVYDKNGTEDKTKWEKYAIELKYPLNGQVPNQMYSFLKDICFCEKLVDNGQNDFDVAFAVALVNDKDFYYQKTKPIYPYPYPYGYFRFCDTIRPRIMPVPTGKQSKIDFEITGTYKIVWNDAKGIADKNNRSNANGKYYLLSIDKVKYHKVYPKEVEVLLQKHINEIDNGDFDCLLSEAQEQGIYLDIMEVLKDAKVF